MEVFLRDIPPEGLDLSFEADPAQLDLVDTGMEFQGMIHAQLSISKEGDRVFVTGCIETNLVLECGLCLKKFPCPLNLGVHAQYLSSDSGGIQKEQELKHEDVDVIFYSGETLQFDDLIREQIYLAVPMHPVCTPGCLGLCPQCGQDLNTGICRCVRGETDPRFSVLKEYFKKGS
jgi:uncharacterized protein